MASTDQKIQRQMLQHARFLLDFFAKNGVDGAPTNFSRKSLHQLDGVIHHLWGEAGPRMALEQMVTIWGAYLGCVLHKNYKAEWIDDDKGPALRLKGKSEITIYPFSMMYKRLVNGSLDKLGPKIEQIERAYHGR